VLAGIATIKIHRLLTVAAKVAATSPFPVPWRSEKFRRYFVSIDAARAFQNHQISNSTDRTRAAGFKPSFTAGDLR
jgi:hypothetical protein